MGLFFNRDRNNTGLLAGMNAQITRADVRNGGNFPINTPGMPPPKAGMPPGPDPRMNTAEAREQQQTLDRSARRGGLGSFGGGVLGTVAGTALTPFLGPMGPILGSVAGSVMGGGLAQLSGGVAPDAGDLLGYGASGAIGGAAGGLVSGLAGQAGGGIARTLGTVGGGAVGGRIGLGAAANTLGLNTEYDPRYRYFVNPNNREIQSAY